MQKVEDEPMNVNSDSELDSNSKLESDEDLADMEDIEEGEIRPNVHTDKVGQVVGQTPVTGVEEVGQSGDGTGSPVVNEQSQESEGSPVPQKAHEVNSNMGNQNLHGEENNSAHVCSHEVDTGRLFNRDPNVHMANGPMDGGPVGSSSIED
ncbi:hypothetical protein Hanom_Chr02g00141801 [Helianthus anomalus]